MIRQSSHHENFTLLKAGNRCSFYDLEQHLDIPIYRFMPLRRFFQLLTTKAIFFSALENYFQDDHCECTFFPDVRYSTESDRGLLSRARELLHTIMGGVSPELGAEARIAAFQKLETDKQIDALKNWERQAFGKSIVCNCWYLGPGESAAMWKLYGKETGVAVESTPRLLDGAIRGFAKPLLRVFDFCPEVARIRYDRVADDYYANCPWLFKLSEFSEEKELRVFAKTTTLLEPGVEILFDVNKLIRRVWLTPFAERRELEALKACVEKLIDAYGLQFARRVSVSKMGKSDLPRDPTLDILSKKRLSEAAARILFSR